MSIIQFVGCLICIAILGITGHMGEQDAVQAEIQYCEQVSKFKAGDPSGWPDYNGNYAEICKK